VDLWFAHTGVMHITSRSRIAVVMDSEWLRAAAKALRLMVPCPGKVFATPELTAAKSWVSE